MAELFRGILLAGLIVGSWKSRNADNIDWGMKNPWDSALSITFSLCLLTLQNAES